MVENGSLQLESVLMVAFFLSSVVGGLSKLVDNSPEWDWLPVAGFSAALICLTGWVISGPVGIALVLVGVGADVEILRRILRRFHEGSAL